MAEPLLPRENRHRGPCERFKRYWREELISARKKKNHLWFYFLRSQSYIWVGVLSVIFSTTIKMWLPMIVSSLVIVSTLTATFVIDHRRAQRQKLIFFKKPWVIALIFFGCALLGNLFYRYSLKQQEMGFKEILKGTNIFYAKQIEVTNVTWQKQMEATSAANQVLHSNNLIFSFEIDVTNAYYHKQMGDLTDAFDLDWRHNWFATMAKKLLLDRKYAESAAYYSLSIDVDKEIHRQTDYSDHNKTYYYTALLMTNDTSEARTKYRLLMSDNIARLKEQGNAKQLEEVQGEIMMVEPLVSPNFVSALEEFATNIADWRMNH